MSSGSKDIVEFDSPFERLNDQFNALQDELSGVGFSRQSRLGNHRDEVAERRGASRKSRSASDAALEYALATRSYKELHKAAWEALTEAESLAAQQILRLEEALAVATADLNTLIESAATLPGGTKVFRDAEGRIWSGDGRDLTHLEDHIVWTGNEPTWEELKAQRDRVADISAQLSEWQRYQVTVLGEARGRLSDQDNPLSADELEEILREIDEEMPPLEADLTEAPTQGVEASAPKHAALPELTG